MRDLYTNYDCDVQCTNLFETLCRSLSANAMPADGSPQLNMLHQMTNIMGALAGEEDPAGRTASAITQARGQADDVEEPTGVTRRTPQNLQMSAEEIAAATRLTGERLGDLMYQSNISEERLAELNRHFGDPGPHEPGHED
mgnify:CR=1 FL=1